jgi:hypothetical protein
VDVPRTKRADAQAMVHGAIWAPCWLGNKKVARWFQRSGTEQLPRSGPHLRGRAGLAKLGAADHKAGK